MKKLLGISIVAVLAVTPLMANAAPLVNVPQTIAATSDVASTSYVKGAHKELGTAINLLGTKVDELEAGGQHLEAGNGIEIKDGNKITVKLDTDSGLSFDSTSKALELSADVKNSLSNAADKNLSNLSDAGTTVITNNVKSNAVSGTYSSTGNYDENTIGKALQGKQDTISDLAAIRSGAAAGATALQPGSALNGANLTAGSVTAAKLAEDAKSLFDVDGAAAAAETAAKTYADGVANTAEQNAKTYADNAATTAATAAETAAKTYADGVANTAEQNAKTYADSAATAAETAAKDYADQKLVNVHTTWGSDTVVKADVIVNPTSGGQS